MLPEHPGELAMTMRDALMKDILKLLEAVGRDEGMRPLQAFEKFLEAGFRALRGKTLMPGSQRWLENEDFYEKVFTNLQKPDAAKQRFAEIMGNTALAIDERCADFLGPLWMEIGASSSMGQFFTPHELSRLSAQLTLGNIKELLGKVGRPFFTAQEPAAGMGGMVLATAELMREEGLDPSVHAFWHMIELDYTVFRGCYVQTSLAGIAGAVFHGNTLSLQMISAHYTPAVGTFLAAHRMSNVPTLDVVPATAEMAPLP